MFYGTLEPELLISRDTISPINNQHRHLPQPHLPAPPPPATQPQSHTNRPAGPAHTAPQRQGASPAFEIPVCCSHRPRHFSWRIPIPAPRPSLEAASSARGSQLLRPPALPPAKALDPHPAPWPLPGCVIVFSLYPTAHWWDENSLRADPGPLPLLNPRSMWWAHNTPG